MNDTNITSRQSYVLNLINQSSGLFRNEIQNKIKTLYNVSKPTLIRDLNVLNLNNLIRVQGKAKNLKYYPFSQSPILKKFNSDLYFQEEPDKRIGAKKIFNFRIFDYLQNIFNLSELNKIDRYKKSFVYQINHLPHDIVKKELERFVIELSWKSSKIEGNTYSLLETEALIKDAKEAKNKSKEETAMILNHKESFDLILKHKSEFKKISLPIINQLHNVLVKKLNINTGIRKNAVGISGTVYRPLIMKSQIIEALEKLIKTINQNSVILEKALIISAMIPYIQPFNDGNKRTARMLVNALLLAYDYYPLSYRSIDEDEFKKSLILFYEQNSIYYLKRLFIEQLIFSYDNYFK